MKFRCAKCGSEIPVPPEIIEEVDGAVVSCPGCGARYRRRRKTSVRAASDDHISTSAPDRDPAPPSTSPTDSTAGAPSAPPQSRESMRSTPADESAPTIIERTVSPAPTVPPKVTSPSPEPAPQQTTERTFRVDQVVARRYRILRFVAKGGMGEVWEAEDLELGERVALKTVRSRTAGRNIAVERFKREIQLARKVTHPNVCRIFDVGRHPTSDDPEQDVIFLTMELLPGGTLARRLRETGPLVPGEALAIVRQLAAGLAAAHTAGIVHRDFKSDNVILVPAPEGPRAVITDFGVARARTEEHKLDVKVTSAGDIVGTPAYMAPEQLTGGEITAAADVYALGIVVYEMVTGRVPFIADTPLATAALRLTHSPPPPRTYVPDLEPRWEEAILQCLDREPERRFSGDALELARYLAREDRASLEEAAAAQRTAFEQEKQQAVERERERTLEQEAVKQEADRRRRARTQRLRLVLASILVIASIFLLVTRVRQKLEETPTLAGFPTGSIEARRSVAVLGFRNVSGQEEAHWLSTALAEMFRTELARGGHLRLIPGENVARMKLELAIAEVDSLATDTLRRIRDNLGTDYVLLGSYVALSGGDLRFDLRLQNASSGQIMVALAENGSEDQLFEIVARSGEAIRGVLDVDPTLQGMQEDSPLPHDSEAARLYSEALDHLRRFDPHAARDLLDRAAEIEPDNALVHAARATALVSLGYEREGLEASRRAFDLSAELPDQDRLSVEGQYRETARHWDRASQIYESLWRAFPDNLEYGLRLAGALTAAGLGQDALTTVEVLRRLPAPAADDPRIDLAEAAAAVSLGQYPRQEAAAAEAAKKAEKLGALLLVAQARLTRAEALRHLGRLEEARVAVTDARRIYEETEVASGRALALAEEANILFAAGELQTARNLYEESRQVCRDMGDQGCVLRAINNLAVVQRNQGELDAAADHYEEVLALSREVGTDVAEVNALNNLGAVLFAQGRLAEARSRFQESFERARELGRKSNEALALSNEAAVLRAQGNLTEAGELQQRALEIRRDLGHVPGHIASLTALGALDLDRGDLDSAQRRFEEALAMASNTGNENLRAEALHNLGEVSARRSLTVEARERFEQAADIRRRLGQKPDEVRSRLALAALAIDERAPESAATAARALAEELARGGALDDAAQAQLILARAELEAGRDAAAREAIARASDLASRSERRSLDLEVRTERGRILAVNGDTRQARTLLEQASAEAEELGLVERVLEARLALTELEPGSSTATELRALEREALGRGYARLAHRAAEAAIRIGG